MFEKNPAPFPEFDKKSRTRTATPIKNQEVSRTSAKFFGYECCKYLDKSRRQDKDDNDVVVIMAEAVRCCSAKWL